ncbi:MAG TPA: N-acetyl-gamma-glutamyl-phosphate reductase [Terriglobia bacterium]|nr:N-acetyl-gamma-glutamyl-phosphate reductase [Terriglobia bacterium]
MNNYSVAIVGITGYTGRELDSLLRRHPSVVVRGRFASRSVPGVEAYTLDAVRQARPDVVMLATEHEVSMKLAPELLDAGFRVIDLSGAFRLKDPAAYPRWYGFEHTAPALLEHSVYGIPEFFPDRIRSAHLVANPGCYATSAILPLAPLFAAGAVAAGSTVVVDGKSGVSGAGRHPKPETHFCEVNENLKAYGVLRHRHTPEMLEAIPGASADRFVFTPHLIPITRGILTTIVFQSAGVAPRAVLADRYAQTPFVKVTPEGAMPDIHSVAYTNFCHIGVASSGAQTVVVSAIDNLVKGAAGQAVQNLNLMLGCDPGAGLL